MPDTCSVIIPCYNASPFIGEAIQSVLNQTVPVSEIIVVDDGCSDDSARIAEGFGAPVRVIRQKNTGVAKARNAGFVQSKGTWIAFLDADDLWLPDKLEKQFAKTKQDYLFVYCDAENFGECDKLSSCRMAYTTLYEGQVFEHLLVGNFISTSGVLVHREVLKRTELFSDRFVYAEDWAMWLRIATLVSFGCVHEPLVRYRVHSAGISKNTHNVYDASLKILSWVRTIPESRRFSARTWRLARSNIEGRRAWAYDLKGLSCRSAGCYVLALIFNPWCGYRWKALIRTIICMFGMKK